MPKDEREHWPTVEVYLLVERALYRRSTQDLFLDFVLDRTNSFFGTRFDRFASYIYIYPRTSLNILFPLRIHMCIYVCTCVYIDIHLSIYEYIRVYAYGYYLYKLYNRKAKKNWDIHCLRVRWIISEVDQSTKRRFSLVSEIVCAPIRTIYESKRTSSSSVRRLVGNW